MNTVSYSMNCLRRAVHSVDFDTKMNANIVFSGGRFGRFGGHFLTRLSALCRVVPRKSPETLPEVHSWQVKNLRLCFDTFWVVSENSVAVFGLLAPNYAGWYQGEIQKRLLRSIRNRSQIYQIYQMAIHPLDKIQPRRQTSCCF